MRKREKESKFSPGRGRPDAGEKKIIAVSERSRPK